MNKRGTGLIYYIDIDKGLRVGSEEAMDHVTLILAGEDRFDQGGEFLHSERSSDQAFAG